MALSLRLLFVPSDFQQENGSLLARKTISITILDDHLYEGDEQFHISLGRAAGLSPEVILLDPQGGSCSAECPNPFPVTIRDNDEVPVLGLSTSTDRIQESGETGATIILESRNGSTFPTDQLITVNFRGPAVYGDDLAIIPGDSNDSAHGHQVTLPSGSRGVQLTVRAIDDTEEEACEWIDVSAVFGDEPTPIMGTARIVVIDDDGLLDNITPLTVGLSGITTGELHECDEGQDWYSFEATGGTSYVIEVKHPLTFLTNPHSSFGNAVQVPGYLVDPSILEITNDQGNQLLGEHDQGGFALNWARAFFTPGETGTYRVNVGAGSQDRAALGSYTITVRADDHSDDYRVDPSVVLRPGESITASIDTDVAYDDPGLNWWDWNSEPDPNFDDGPDHDYLPRRGIESLDDRDVFRYEISEAGDYTLSLSAQPNGVGIWYLWDYKGNLWYDAWAEPEESIEGHHEPGTYYVEVGTPYESEGNTGTYNISLEAVG